MANTRFNIVFGERYGDVNDPKTRWMNSGSLFVGQDFNRNDPAPEDVEALNRLIENGNIRLRIEQVPVTKAFDGWFSIFTPKERDYQPNQQSAKKADLDDDDDKPIDLTEIPF